MKILQVISHYVPAYRYGGPLRVAHGLSRALVDLGHEVTVCCTNLADETSDLDVPLDHPIDVDGAAVYYEPTRYSRYWGYSPKLKARVKKEVPNADVVLVHAHYQYANYVGARESLRAGKPYVIFPHNSLRERGITFKSGRLKRMYLGSVERWNLQHALFLAFNSAEEKNGSIYSEFGVVIPNGITPSDLSEGPPAGWFRRKHPELAQKTIFLFLGRQDFQQKGLDMLIPGFAEVYRKHPEIHLVLAGPDHGGGADQVLRCARELGVEQAITCTGLLDGQDKLGVLQDSDAFVLPSQYEGMSIALLEALYFGIPVLVTDQVGICREISERKAGLVVPATQVGVNAGLAQLVDPATRNEFRGRGVTLVKEKYNWGAITNQLLVSIHESRQSVST